LYFVLFVIFLALIIGPLIAGPKVNFAAPSNALLDQLIQPVGYNNNDTISSQTGTAVNGGATATDGSSPTSASASSAASVTAGSKFRVRMY
jgi:1,3-beta-glucan synthase